MRKCNAPVNITMGALLQIHATKIYQEQKKLKKQKASLYHLAKLTITLLIGLVRDRGYTIVKSCNT